VTDNGKDVKEGAALAVSVMETNFFDSIELAIPDEPFRVNFAAGAIKSKTNRNRFGYSLGHG
jgi:hypothetical protein